ncbi:MAG: class I SAM-dependent RNA methyltransferase [Clostridia bacterium]|nr:class I SAM-dependent RNA methyltransferase [Clostridia bacterium]
MNDYKIIVTSAFGIESVVKRELYKLGYGDVPAVNGTFEFSGSALDVARCNMFLRSADRVMIKLAEFECKDFDTLFDNVNKIEWGDYLSIDGQFIVNGKCVDSTLFGVSACQSIIKKAIIVKLTKKYNVRTFSESAERYKINFAIINDVCSIYLDTSGDGLHKRGYRDIVGEASIKETLAAAIIQLSVYNQDKDFADLFCGSGTFPIEAALYATRRAPGMNRKFDYEFWQSFPNVRDKAQEEADEMVRRDIKPRIFGFDIDKRAIQQSIRHAEQAGVRDLIHFQCADQKDFSSRKAYGVICTNPPYGERLSNEKEVFELMKSLSVTYSNLQDWSLYLITSFQDLEKAFGRKADKNRKLFNGRIECRLYQFLGRKPNK